MNEIRNEINIETAGSAAFSVEGFARVFARHLEDAEQVFDINVEILNCKGPRAKRLEIFGYAEDTTEQSLIILAGKYFGSDETLVLSEAKDVLSRALGFVEHSVDGWIAEHLDISSREFEYAKYFENLFARKLISKLKIVLITDGFMSDRIKTIDSTTLGEVKVVYEIWDQRRILESEISDIGSEDIVVDFKKWLPNGLPCLVAETADASTETYLAVIPGRVLFEIFEEYGSLLLESNVRTFLSARGAVNKGIQATLAQEPDRFLAYNNGLTTTATQVSIDHFDSGTYISSIEKWQIVNGGQTTASIAHFLRGDKNRSINSVFVQMKLVKVTDSDAAAVVQAVAKYANSQNKVSGADLFATHEFHIRLEQISRRLKAPAKEGQQYMTGWYYERARNQWENEKISRGTAADQKKFELEFPRNQKIAKTHWAVVSYCWGKKPHIVSKGAQSVFAEYAVAVDNEWEKDNTQFNDAYFQRNISKAIMYENLRSAVLKQEWFLSSRGYLANIVAYAISKFSQELDSKFPNSRFNFEKVWKYQSLSSETLEVLINFAREAQLHLTDPSRPQANVTQWAKQQACWDGFSRKQIQLGKDIVNDLLTSAEFESAVRDAKKTQAIDNEFQDIQRVMNVPKNIWSEVIGAMSQVPISPTETELIAKFGSGEKVPTERQARALLRMLARFSDIGIIGKTDY